MALRRTPAAKQQPNAPVQQLHEQAPVSSGGAHPGAFKSAYVPESQGGKANRAFPNQSPAAQYSRSNPHYSQRKKSMSTAKKAVLGVFIALAVVVAGAGTALAVYLNTVNQNLAGNKTQEELTAISEVLAPAAASFNEPFYLMLLGSDERAGDEESGQRSDTNIVVRVDPVKKQISLVSIPRDTAINLDGYGTVKFNAAYMHGGTASAIEQATKLTGVGISYYAEVNFDGLIDLVDAVGGVDVVVDERIDDPDAGDVVIEAGNQHLDGKAALVFARSRAYVDGDYTRVANQRKLIMAIAQKVLTMPSTEMPGVIQAAAKCTTTNMTVQDIVALAQQLRSGDNADLVIYSATIPSVPEYIDGVSYVFADTEGVKEMMKVVAAGGDPSTVTATRDSTTIVNEYLRSAGLTASIGSSTTADAYGNYNGGTSYGYGTGTYNNDGYTGTYSSPGTGAGAGGSTDVSGGGGTGATEPVAPDPSPGGGAGTGTGDGTGGAGASTQVG